MNLKPIPLSDWGRDHWSTLGYIECRCVDNRGIPDRDHMRCNPARHPGLSGRGGWKPQYSTRLKGHSIEVPLQRAGHDDWDCAYDIEVAGLLIDEGSGINPLWKLTPLGLSICAALRAHKAAGGSFATFNVLAATP